MRMIKTFSVLMVCAAAVLPLYASPNEDLIYAVQGARAADAETALRAGARVDAKDSDGNTALLCSAMLLSDSPGDAQYNTIRLLINKGARINAQTVNGDTVLHLLASSSADIDKTYIGIIELAIERGADINAANEAGLTPLICAATVNQLEIAKLFLSKKAKPNAAAKNGDTALLLAVKHGQIDIIKALVSGGAQIDMQDSHGNTALILAADGGDKKGFLEIVSFLVEHHADVNKKNKRGKTARMIAQEKNFSKISNILKEAGGR